MCWVNKNMKNHQFKLKGKEKKRNRKTPFTAPLGYVEFKTRAAAQLVGCRGTGASGFWSLGFRHHAAAQIIACRGRDLSDLREFDFSASCRGRGIMPAAAGISILHLKALLAAFFSRFSRF